MANGIRWTMAKHPFHKDRARSMPKFAFKIQVTPSSLFEIKRVKHKINLSTKEHIHKLKYKRILLRRHIELVH